MTDGGESEDHTIPIQTVARVKHHVEALADTQSELWLSRMQGIFRLIVLAACYEAFTAR